jgi:two-component system LytT family response regulator
VTRVLIADDEKPARQRLRQLLLAHPNFEVVAEAETGAQTMELVASHQPDLLLLDIQMAGGTGLDVAACLPAPRPAIIFCTAFDQHAVDAFELNAIDYLLKPVSRSRLEKALARITDLSAKDGETIDRLLAETKQRLSRFLVYSESRYLVVPANEVAYFESLDGLTRLVTKTGKAYWMDLSIQEIEQRVDQRTFFRISRAVLVSLNTVGEVHPLPGGSAMILTKSGIKLEVSRRRFRDLLKFLEES